MRYISLKNTSLTYFNIKGKMSELSGSSQYNVFDNVIEKKISLKKNKIESTSAITDYLTVIDEINSSHEAIRRMKTEFKRLLDICIIASFNKISERDRLDKLNEEFRMINYLGEKKYIEKKRIESLDVDKRSGYFAEKKQRSEFKEINKTKVKGKMYALFNLKCSKKFMAFYSVSFPLNTTDNQAFICWNYWLTQLRKKFELSNYIWVSERQKNGTLHFHMLTNNYMPILSINRVMAIIIDNQVKKNVMTWEKSSLDRYNGVDVDSIYNSKRHKKTGKLLNPSELRNWISSYVTKYVTKNSEKFKHLCWHCSRSISILFTSTIIELKNSLEVTNHLPTIRDMYIFYKGQFNEVWVFCFVPPDCIFEKIKWYNDMIFTEHEPINNRRTKKINLKTIKL